MCPQLTNATDSNQTEDNTHENITIQYKKRKYTNP